MRCQKGQWPGMTFRTAELQRNIQFFAGVRCYRTKGGSGFKAVPVFLLTLSHEFSGSSPIDKKCPAGEKSHGGRHVTFHNKPRMPPYCPKIVTRNMLTITIKCFYRHSLAFGIRSTNSTDLLTTTDPTITRYRTCILIIPGSEETCNHKRPTLRL